MLKIEHMKKISLLIVILILIGSIDSFAQTAEQILNKIDDNMSAENQVATTTMIIHGKRNSRTLTSIGYSVGDKKSFSEYLSPAREQGTKMLKLENQLWIYSPSTDRTIQISGHMLRQSVMGSDLSYEDMMDDRKLTEMYDSKIVGEEVIDGTKTKVLELTAKVDDVAYHSRKLWVDTEKYVPLKEDLFAKSGQLLKQTKLSDVKKIEGRWYPTKMVYKDMLKQGDGTEFIVDEIKFNQDIPEYIFTKAALKQ
jgi:negative regulator of sigma E activity